MDGVTPALAVMAATVALTLGGLTVIAVLVAIRDWKDTRP